MTLLAALFRRTSRLTSRRWFRLGLLIASCIVLVDLWLTVRVSAPQVSRPLLAENGNAIGDGAGRFRPPVEDVTWKKEREKLFIASIHWNDEKILSAHWIPALLSLIESYGAENLYISIHESGSWDNTKNVLRDLDKKLGELGVEKRVVLEEKTHEDVIKLGEDEIQAGAKKEGWIMGSRGRMEMRRIPFLAAARNKAMIPLRELAGREGEGRRVFNKVVWLNDVIFTPDQVSTLLSTLNGSYTAACALDFTETHKFYDSFAVRDTFGLPALTQGWPFFSSPISRQALQNYLPTPVKSCWNGLVILDAAPFYANPPLEFRGIDDKLAEKHVEGSECCLIHADIKRMARGEDPRKYKGVWINPNVRVGYNVDSFKGVNMAGGWPTRYGKIDGVWANRWHWATGWYWRWRERWIVEGAVRTWEREGKERKEEGAYCLEDSMQVLVENGWVHI
ncbi:glycosyltransferase family 69 protein [Stipitochalara longipes BDJ]|nr:glycosyltransferase family 69 protein [Stipitochalara longipes BDJ]